MSPNQFIGHYRITSKLGEGGMGEVWRATDTKLNREVAIKILPRAFSSDPDRPAHFSREARVLASLSHSNIAAIYAIEEGALVMELVEAPTLAERVMVPMPVEEVRPILSQLVDVLEYAHGKGVIHRDLKPANIKVTPAGKVKVLDFGLAKAVAGDPVAEPPTSESPTVTMDITAARTVVGTAAYMSPEQTRGHRVDKRADIWSFGVVAYEMLAGRQLFSRPTISDTLAAVLKEEPDYDRIPATMRRLVRSCLVKDPRARMRDIGDAPLAMDEDGVELLRRRSPLPWALVAALALVLAAVSTVHFRETPPEPGVIRFQISPPEGGAFAGRSLSLSPDGRRLAFTAPTKNGPPLLWVRALDSVEALALPNTEEAVFPFWSPDSRSLAFWSAGRLRRIEVGGSTGPGPPQTLCTVRDVFGADWSRDGVILFGTLENGVFRVPETGGEPTQIAVPDKARGESSYPYPQFLPDSRQYLYLSVASSRERTSAVYLGSLDGKETKRLLPADNGFSYAPPSAPSRPGHLLFTRDYVLMAQPLNPRNFEPVGSAFPVAQQVRAADISGFFTISRNGVLAYRSGSPSGAQLIWFDRAGKPLGTVGERAPYSDIALSRDGNRAAVEQLIQATTNGDLWLIDLARRVPTRFTFDAEHRNWDPVWSPDGSWIAFASNRDGPFTLYMKDSSGVRQEERLRKTEALERPCDWSLDGRTLMYVRAGGSFNLWVLSDPLGDPANRKAYPYLETSSNTTQCQISPDSHWVAYTSDESHHGNEIYVQSFPAGSGRFQVSRNGGVQPRWRRDGKELFFVAGDGKLMAVDVKTAPAFEAAVPHVLFDAHISAGVGARFAFRYDVSPDGERFLINDTNQPIAIGPQQITVVTNWEAGLKMR
jgi:Tol biopolymer transport system component